MVCNHVRAMCSDNSCFERCREIELACANFTCEGMKSYRGKLSYLPADAMTSSFPTSDDSAAGEDNNSVVRTSLLPPLASPVPDSWKTVDTEFILVGAVYQSHLAKDNRMAVHSTLDDGLIHLLWVKTGISRLG